MNPVKIGITVLLLAIALAFGYFLYASIERPIHFQNEWTKREEAVRKRLKELADLQNMHKGLTNIYAPDYESLKSTLLNDTFRIEKVIGDPNDTTIQVVRKIVAIPAVDSLQSFVRKNGYEDMGVETYLGQVIQVPFSKGETFYIKADSASVDAEGKTYLPTFEVGVQIGKYMEEFDSSGYAIYDPRYNPVNIRKVGDLYKPSTSGNW